MTLTGKGFFIWQINRCEAGDVEMIANLASQAGFSHVIIKIADGVDEYNVNPQVGVDFVPLLIQALRDRSISPWGWQTVYGYDPIREAHTAIQRIQALDLDGFVIDAEDSYQERGRQRDARTFMEELRDAMPSFPFALSSYKFPSLHPGFPWQEFLEYCEFNMPQMFWLGAHNPEEHLVRSLREFENIHPFRPIIPTGPAFKSGKWQPSASEITAFLRMVQSQNLTAINFWEWSSCRLDTPEIWDEIGKFPWRVDRINQDIVQRYFEALNSHQPDQMIELYHPNAVHVTPARTIQGHPSIRLWYSNLFEQVLPDAKYTLTGVEGRLGWRQFTWTANSMIARVDDGQDSVGLIDGLITYHYTHFTTKNR